MPKNNGKTPVPQSKLVLFGAMIDRDLRKRGKVAIEYAGYESITEFIEEKLEEVIERAEKKFISK